MTQMIVVVKQDDIYDVQKLNNLLKDNWKCIIATHLNGFSHGTCSYRTGEVRYILEKNNNFGDSKNDHRS